MAVPTTPSRTGSVLDEFISEEPPESEEAAVEMATGVSPQRSVLDEFGDEQPAPAPAPEPSQQMMPSLGMEPPAAYSADQSRWGKRAEGDLEPGEFGVQENWLTQRESEAREESAKYWSPEFEGMPWYKDPKHKSRQAG